MINLNSQHSPTFGHRYRPFYNEVQQTIFKLRDKGIQSHTYWNTIKVTDDMSFTIKNDRIIPSAEYLTKAIEYYKKIKKKINAVRLFRRFAIYKDEHEAIQDLLYLTDKYKVANCIEQSRIIHHMLKQKNIPSQVIIAYFDHAFVGLNIKKGADIANPKTWGKDAYIADPWLGKVFHSVEEAMTEYKKIFTMRQPKAEEKWFEDVTSMAYSVDILNSDKLKIKHKV